MGEELDRLFAWLRDHPEWSCEITHRRENNAFRVEIRMTRGRRVIGQKDWYYPDDTRLMKASLWTMVDELIDAATDINVKER